MSLNITKTTPYSNNLAVGSKSSTKPVWNPNKVYKYLEDMNEAGLEYGRQAVKYYSSMIAKEQGDGTLSADELKAQIKELFPEYTMINSEPDLEDVVKGKHLLYIDEKNLQKMCSDPKYRAEVYGLMDRELTGIKGFTLEYSDGRNVTAHMTCGIFSLSEKNEKHNGIPYAGSGQSDHPFSTSESHPQVRNMSYLYENLNPKSSGSNSSKSNSAKAAKDAAKKRDEKRIEQRQADKKAFKERLEKKRKERTETEEELQEKLQNTAEQMMSNSKYKGASDIAVNNTLQTMS